MSAAVQRMLRRHTACVVDRLWSSAWPDSNSAVGAITGMPKIAGSSPLQLLATDRMGLWCSKLSPERRPGPELTCGERWRMEGR